MNTEKDRTYQPVENRNVKIQDPFWSEYIGLVRGTVLPYMWEILNDREPEAKPSHAILNFQIAAGLKEGDFFGEVFQDSDLAKWIEAVSYSLECEPNAEMEAIVDAVVDLIGQAQDESGYLNTYFETGRMEKHWTNLYECHEMYCAGHMMEAAAAYYRATGKRKLLDIMCRFAVYIQECFGKEGGKRQGYPGHQEIELALVKLYHATGDKKYLELSRYFVEERGTEPNYFMTEWETSRDKKTFKTDTYVGEPDLYYNQSYTTVDRQKQAVGHAVRAMYMYSSMADLALELQDETMLVSCKRLWNNVVNRQMYITGAIGATPTGEAFTFDYDLPNETAYAETCASIGLIFFAHRMQKLDVNNVYGDVIERALYNVVLGAMSQDGKRFLYVNPLEIWPTASRKNPERKHVMYARQKWFGCACCPPNIARLLTSIGEYIYSCDQDTTYVHLYMGSEADCRFPEGSLYIRQTGNYPWDGTVTLTIGESSVSGKKIALRVPGWCRQFRIYRNGVPEITRTENGYCYLGDIEGGDEIRIEMLMQPEFIQANPKVRANTGKVAITRGPIVYCMESADNGDNLKAISVCPTVQLQEEVDNTLFPNAVVLTGTGERILEKDWEDILYRPFIEQKEQITYRAIPYFLWGNRTQGELTVWFRM